MSTKPEGEEVGNLAVPVGGPVPVGTVVTYAGVLHASSIAKLYELGWLPCNGEEQPTKDFADLFSVIGYSHGGSGDKFRVPDLRGRFVRGVDAGAKRDPDAGFRKEAAAGGNKGDQVGSVQGDEIRKHSHSVPNVPQGLHWATDMLEKYYVSQWNSQSRDSSEVGGSETRPVNVALNYIIRYRKGN